MSVIVKSTTRAETRELISRLRGGTLSDEEARILDACTNQLTQLWIGYIHDKPVCAWGLVPPTLLADAAYLWLYSTDEIEYTFTFIRHSQLAVAEMKKLYPVIYGVCLLSQPKSIKWLTWLGAEFHDPIGRHVPFTIRGDNG